MQTPSGSSKRSPIFSGLSLAIAAFLLLGLGLAAWLTGGAVFNPGPVSAKSAPNISLQSFHSHADFENNCNLCHQPLARSQADLCQDCHGDIRQELNQKNGTHGRLTDGTQCSACHSEHKGRDFDPSQTALAQFNHNLTPFPLVGKHAQAQCQDCHRQQGFGGTSPACVSCHQEPQVHTGMFDADCSACHTALAWKPAEMNGKAFDHNVTRFTLARHTRDYSGQAMRCAACHTNMTAPFATASCANCHAQHAPSGQPQALDFLAKHTATYGSDCLQCHDGADRTHGFQHQTVFPLTGKHASLACDGCHAGHKFNGTPGACVACHAEPEIHKGYFGLSCEYCHTSDAWRPALLREHNFPLDHASKGDLSCQTCHTERYSSFTCFGCHEHTPDGIRKSHANLSLPEGVKLEQCTVCHLDGKKPAP